MNEAERELEELIHSETSPLIVLLGEPFNPAARAMGDRLRYIAGEIHSLKLIDISLTGYRQWGRKYRVVGTPSTLLFENGKCLFHRRGVYEKEALFRMLEERL